MTMDWDLLVRLLSGDDEAFAGAWAVCLAVPPTPSEVDHACRVVYRSRRA